GDGVTFTADADATVYCQIRYASGASADETFYPMIRLASIEDDTYEPYAKTNQQLTKDSVDWESNSALGAKNFLHTNGSQTTRGVLFECDENGVFTVTRQTADSNHAYYNNGRFTLKPGTYIFSNGYNSIPSGIQATYLYNYTDSAYFTNCNNGPKTFTITEEKELAFNIEVQSSQSPNDVKIYPMIRLASDNDATYQPYAKTNLELTEESQITDITSSVTDSSLSYTSYTYCLSKNGIVELNYVVSTALTADTNTVVGTLPSGYIPYKKIYTSLRINGIPSGYAMIETDGTITFHPDNANQYNGIHLTFIAYQ
nr:hypothetical protein [Butyrivibrio sp.]